MGSFWLRLLAVLVAIVLGVLAEYVLLEGRIDWPVWAGVMLVLAAFVIMAGLVFGVGEEDEFQRHVRYRSAAEAGIVTIGGLLWFAVGADIDGETSVFSVYNYPGYFAFIFLWMQFFRLRDYARAEKDAAP